MMVQIGWQRSKWKDSTTHWRIKTKSLISKRKRMVSEMLKPKPNWAPEMFAVTVMISLFLLSFCFFKSFTSAHRSQPLITVMLKCHNNHPPQSQAPFMESASSPSFVSATSKSSSPPHPTKLFLFSSLYFLPSQFPNRGLGFVHERDFAFNKEPPQKVQAWSSDYDPPKQRGMPTNKMGYAQCWMVSGKMVCEVHTPAGEEA